MREVNFVFFLMKSGLRLALLAFGLSLLGVTYTLTNTVEARDCSHCYKLESQCRRQSKGQANCDAVVSRCLRQCRRG